MKKNFIIFFLLLISYKLFPQSTYFCINGPIGIYNKPDINSEILGTLNLFDIVSIIEKTEIKTIIDGMDDFWIKISFNGIEGYVFGGYGIILMNKYDIKTIDDFITIFPSNFNIIELKRRIITHGAYTGPYDKIPAITLEYDITFMNHSFYFIIYFRPIDHIDENYLSIKFNLEKSGGGNIFGMGDSYRLLIDPNRASDISTFHGNHVRYFFRSWGNEISYDIANFLFEIEFDNYFNGIIITANNLWLNKHDNKNIYRINNDFIKEARINHVKESIIYQILYEIVLRINII